MAFVEMISLDRGNPLPWFGCQWATWDLMLALGREQGWTPAGTCVPPHQQEEWQRRGGFRPTYEVEDFPLLKVVAAGDAAAWAQALLRAADQLGTGLRQLEGPGTRCLSERYPIEALEHLRYGVRAVFIQRFAAFLAQGAFKFLWEDGAERIPPNPDSNLFADAYSFAVSALRAGELEEAEGMLANLMEVEPKDPVVPHTLALLYRQMGRHDRSLETLERAQRAGADSWSLGQAHGNTLMLLGRNAEAAKVLKRTVRKHPEQASCWNALGNALTKLGDFREADHAFDRAEELAPGNLETAINRGNAYLARQEPQRALAVLGPFAEAHPTVPDLQFNLGQALKALGRYAEAARHLERARACSATPADENSAVHNLVVCYLELKDEVKLVETLRRHVELKPDYRPAWSLLSQLAPDAGTRKRAAARLRELEGDG